MSADLYTQQLATLLDESYEANTQLQDKVNLQESNASHNEQVYLNLQNEHQTLQRENAELISHIDDMKHAILNNPLCKELDDLRILYYNQVQQVNQEKSTQKKMEREMELMKNKLREYDAAYVRAYEGLTEVCKDYEELKIRYREEQETVEELQGRYMCLFSCVS